MGEERLPVHRGAAFGLVVAVLLAVGYLGVRPVNAHAAGDERQQPLAAAPVNPAAGVGTAGRAGFGVPQPDDPPRRRTVRGRGPDNPPGHRTFVLAHRGGLERAPENSMAAFDDAVAAGVDYIETDVRHSADGVAFLMHDPLLPRRCTPFAGQPVNLLTAAQLGRVRCSAQPVPRLTDLVARLLRPDAVNVSVMAEVKDTDPLGVRDALAPLGWQRVLVESFNLAALHQIEVASPQVRTCAIFAGAATLADALAVTHDCVAPEYHAVGAALVDRAHQAGAIVLPWTVDDPAAMAHLVSLGCDGLITDRPRTAPR